MGSVYAHPFLLNVSDFIMQLVIIYTLAIAIVYEGLSIGHKIQYKEIRLQTHIKSRFPTFTILDHETWKQFPILEWGNFQSWSGFGTSSERELVVAKGNCSRFDSNYNYQGFLRTKEIESCQLLTSQGDTNLSVTCRCHLFCQHRQLQRGLT